MREIDREEAEAMGRSPKEALRTGLRTSLHCFTALMDGKPIAMLGVASASLLSGKGIPWLLGTDDVYRQGRALLDLGPPVFDLFLQIFTRIENLVSVRNTRAIRLLARWGFVVGGEVQTFGGVEFVPFRMERGSIQEREAGG